MRLFYVLSSIPSYHALIITTAFVSLTMCRLSDYGSQNSKVCVIQEAIVYAHLTSRNPGVPRTDTC